MHRHLCSRLRDVAVVAVPSIVENAIATPALSTLVAVLTMPAYAPVLSALSGSGPFTVFAPTNDAFAAAGVDVNDVAAVTAVLQYHVISGVAAYSGDLASSQEVATLQGDSVLIRKAMGAVTVQGVDVVIADVVSLRDNRLGTCVHTDDALCVFMCVLFFFRCFSTCFPMPSQRSSNGVVHVIDQVLVPGERTPPYACTTPSSMMHACTSHHTTGMHDARLRRAAPPPLRVPRRSVPGPSGARVSAGQAGLAGLHLCICGRLVHLPAVGGRRARLLSRHLRRVLG